MLDMKARLLLSMKPRYAELVFNGAKTAELRKRISPYMKNRDVFIYVTSPVRQLRGGFRVEHVWSGSPEEVWVLVSDKAGINKQDFDAYYEGRTTAYALKIADVWEYDQPFALNTLRERLEYFVVPRSWRYIKPEEQDLFGRPS